jgi:hypothetical protein
MGQVCFFYAFIVIFLMDYVIFFLYLVIPSIWFGHTCGGITQVGPTLIIKITYFYVNSSWYKFIFLSNFDFSLISSSSKFIFLANFNISYLMGWE